MRVDVLLFQPGLVHVGVRVLALGVAVGMRMLDMLMLVAGVCVRVGHAAVVVLVRMRTFVGVLFSHRCFSLSL